MILRFVGLIIDKIFMLVIRLKPIGKKHQISFRIVVAEKRSKLNGPYREDIGFYNPSTDKFSVKTERAKYWLSVGAQPTDTVYNIFVDAGVLEKPKKPVKIKAAKKKKEDSEKKENSEKSAPPEKSAPSEASKVDVVETPAVN